MIAMVVSSFTRNIMFWLCGLLLGLYWGAGPSIIGAAISILISSVVCATIDCYICVEKKEEK